MNIIFVQDNGIIAVITLADNTDIEARAPDLVPKGKKYKIVDSDFLPKDPTYRDAWTIDEALLTDGVGVMK